MQIPNLLTESLIETVGVKLLLAHLEYILFEVGKVFITFLL